MENIRDRGNSERTAEQIQGIVAFLGQVSGERVLPQKTHLERTDLAQAEFDQGWDAMGDFHNPRWRID